MNEIIQVVVFVAPDGSIAYVKAGETNAMELYEKWSKTKTDEQLRAYRDNAVVGGMAIVQMFKSDYEAIPVEHPSWLTA